MNGTMTLMKTECRSESLASYATLLIAEHLLTSRLRHLCNKSITQQNKHCVTGALNLLL